MSRFERNLYALKYFSSVIAVSERHLAHNPLGKS